MDHGYFLDRVSAYFDRDLPPQELALMETHLQSCDECRALLAQFEKLDQLVKQNSELGSDDYWEKSARQIEERLGRAEKTEITDVRPSRRIAQLGWKVVAVAASLVLLGYIGMHKDDIFPERKMETPSVQPRTDKRSHGAIDETGRAQSTIEDTLASEGAEVALSTNEPESREAPPQDTLRRRSNDTSMPNKRKTATTSEKPLQQIDRQTETSVIRESTSPAKQAPAPAAEAELRPPVAESSLVEEAPALPEVVPQQLVPKDTEVFDKAAKALAGQTAAFEASPSVSADSAIGNLASLRHQRDSLSALLAQINRSQSRTMFPTDLSQGLVKKSKREESGRDRIERQLLDICYQLALNSPDSSETHAAETVIEKAASDSISVNRDLASRLLEQLRRR
ncbi:MAG: zf-HC2 domain-containing protein [Candidatus Zixiibacteriota bacterium]